jgi:glucose-1-phosphate cytidylyltransferase
MRLREYSEAVPKPMVPIGQQPILWHVMRYYAHFGHKEFILCLGHKAEVIKNYFVRYEEWLSNDFVLTGGGSKVDLLGADTRDWKITFVDTGGATSIGQRLKRIESHVAPDELFLANYGDTLTDVPLPSLVAFARERNAVGCFLAVRPWLTFHVVDLDPSGRVRGIEDVSRSERMRINGGYFVFRREIFDSIGPGEELIEEPFRRLIAKGKLAAFAYDGFWATMDTFKDKVALEDRWARGDTPWQVWKGPHENGA